MRRSILTIVAGGILTAGCHVGCHMGNDRFHVKHTRSEEMTSPLTDVTGLTVSTNVGKIQLDATDVSEARIYAEIEVKAETEERAQELCEAVRIVAEPQGQRLVVKVVKPPEMGREPLSVDFTITAPARLAIEATTHVGDVHVAGFIGAIKASADVGTVSSMGLRDAVDVHTNVGDIRIACATDASAVLDVRATTNVGNIEFAGPAEISAKLSVATNVGSIDTERPLTVKGSMKQSISASLGDGQGRIDLRTNVGSIKIR